MGKQRVLIIEDEPSLSEIVLRMLEFFGYSGTIAKTGKEALEIFEKQVFDCIIMDLSLPDFSGLQLFKKLTGKNPIFRKKVIFTSGNSTTGELTEIIKKNKLSFLPKPFTVDQFKTVIGHYLR